VEIVIHLTGAVEWSGWALAMVLAGFSAVMCYCAIRQQTRLFKLKHFIRLLRRHPNKTDAEIGEMVETWFRGA
jgi:hypothetical protein